MCGKPQIGGYVGGEKKRGYICISEIGFSACFSVRKTRSLKGGVSIVEHMHTNFSCDNMDNSDNGNGNGDIARCDHLSPVLSPKENSPAT